MNVVVVVSGGITETLQASPLLRTLRAGEPNAQIGLVCPARSGPIAQGIPAVDVVTPRRELGGYPGALAGFRVWLELRRQRVDAVLLCSQSAWLRLAAFLAGVPERIGPRGGLSSFLLTRRGLADRAENRAPQWLRLAALMGIRQELHSPSYEPGAEALREADHLIHGTGFTDGRLLVALAPGTGFAEHDALSGPDAVWDAERYALLCNQLAIRHGAGILFIGAPDDIGVIERTMLDLGASAADLSGEPDVRVVAAIISRCDLFIGGDTPLLHVAAAVGTPAVGLFGPSDGKLRGPYGSDHRIIQGLPPRMDAKGVDGAPALVMDQIRVDDVLASIEASL
ncbi:MAG TPA: glycosyltransferase family 9 protein [Candidatus Dormibacteraeota bacterium]|nr:glycosyltransferase family 9 protein [Candidatus Dormibacteraeota bacterium]